MKLKIELKKALRNRAFYVSIAIAMTCVILSLVYCINIYNNDMEMKVLLSESSSICYAPDLPIYTLFNHWIGGEAFSLGTSVYFFIFPLLCALPYGWSYCIEKKSGYTRTMVVQCGRKKYYKAKYLATFISGGLAMVLPMITSIIMAAYFFPAIKPDVIYDIYYGISKRSLMSQLFYEVPFLYLFIYLCIDFVFCGLLACCSMAATSVIKQKYIVTFIPFLLCVGLELFMRLTYDFSDFYNSEFSPFYYLRPCGGRYPASFLIIAGTALCIFLVTYGVVNIWERKHEIY